MNGSGGFGSRTSLVEEVGSGWITVFFSGGFTGVKITPVLPRFALAGVGPIRSWLAESASLGGSVASDSRLVSPKFGQGSGHDLRASRQPHCFKWGNFEDMPPHPLAIMCFSREVGSLELGMK